MRHTGQTIKFTKSGSNYNPPTAYRNVKLTYSSSTELYTFRDADGTVETYSKYGDLKYYTTPSGNRITIGYSYLEDIGDWRMNRAYDSFGREMQFLFEGGVLSQVTAFDGGIYKYVYDNAHIATGTPNANRLKEVTYPDDTPETDTDNPRVVYHYEDAAHPFALTGITNENGDRYATWAYDSDGRPISSEHAGGVERTTVDHTSGATRTVTNALGKTALYHFVASAGEPRLSQIEGQASANCPAADAFTTYDSNGFVASETDFEGNTTTYVNNSRGLPTTVTEASGSADERTTTITWHATHNLPTQVVEPGLRTDFTYTSGGLVLTRTETDLTTHTVPYTTAGRSRTWTYAYNAEGLLASVDGPRTDVADTTGYTYTAAGYLATVTDALGHVTTVTGHDGMGRPLSVTDAHGVVTDLAYDPRGRLTSVTVNAASGNATTAIAYTPAGDVARITRPDQSYLDFVYDPARRLTSIVDNLGERIDYTLNLAGNRTATMVRAAGGAVTRSTTATFDELGRVLTQVGAGAQVTGFAHDKNSLLVGVTDPLSRQTGYAYDALNRLIQVTDAATNTVPLAYDGRDNLTQVTDQRGLATAYVVDGFGYVIQAASPDTGVTVNVYDEAGNLTRTTDARGVVTDLAYDSLDRLTAKTFPAAGAENVAFTYDGAGAGFGIGRLTGMTDPSGSTAWSYDERGNVVTEVRTINGTPFTTFYAYDLADNLTAITYPSGRVVTYLRDALGRVSEVRSRPTPGGADVTLASTVAYLPFGPVSGLAYGNGLVLARAFDLDYRMTAQAVTATGVTAQDLGYGYDPASNITATNDNRVPARSQGFTYDALDRLTQGTGLYGQLGYTYDAVGNRLTRGKAGPGGFTETSVIGANDNRLVSVTGGAVARNFTYTAAGHVTGDGTLGFTISAAGRNVEAKLNGVTLATYVHNGLGERVKKAVPAGAVTLFHFAASGQLIATSDGAGANWTEYVWLGAMPLAQVQNGTVYYAHADHLNAPQALTDASQAIVWDASFRPFGEVEAASGAVAQNLRFPGQYFDAETGTHYNYFRDYDPALGRYLQSDPIGLAGGLDTYSYVGGNPVRFVDPVGKSPAAAAACFIPGVGWVGCGVAAVAVGIVATAVIAYDYFVRPKVLEEIESWKKEMASVSSPAISKAFKQDCDKNNDDVCYARWEQEDSRCWNWKNLGLRVVKACQTRASIRRDLCIRNGGRSDPNEPPEYSPFRDYPR
jgi:RHS repeat-associated protein